MKQLQFEENCTMRTTHSLPIVECSNDKEYNWTEIDLQDAGERWEIHTNNILDNSGELWLDVGYY
jgi:hypothetical protein